jgi:hypothetical protein
MFCNQGILDKGVRVFVNNGQRRRRELVLMTSRRIETNPYRPVTCHISYVSPLLQRKPAARHSSSYVDDGGQLLGFSNNSECHGVERAPSVASHGVVLLVLVLLVLVLGSQSVEPHCYLPRAPPSALLHDENGKKSAFPAEGSTYVVFSFPRNATSGVRFLPLPRFAIVITYSAVPRITINLDIRGTEVSRLE